MGALRNEASTQLLTFACSAKVSRGDRFISHLQEKSNKYKQLLENLYHKSSIGLAVASITVDRFGEDASTVYFRISLDRKKISRSILNLEKSLKDIILNDSLSRRPVFRNIRFDARSVQIRQILENDNTQQKIISKPKDIKSRNGVLLKPNNKHNMTVTAELPVKKETITEIDVKEEDLPVIQGSFHISKTEADITEKKNNLNDTTTLRSKTTHKTKQPLKTTTPKESSVTSALYKIASASKNERKTVTTNLTTTTTTTVTTTRLPKRSSTKTTTLPTTAKSKKITTASLNTVTKLHSTSTSTETPTHSLTDIKVSFPVNPFLFTIPPHSLDKEPWVPIQKEPEIPFVIPKNPVNLEASPTVSLIELLHQPQPVYTSFTNPGLSFHSINSETLGSTSTFGHPLPVNKISEITEPSVITYDPITNFYTETDPVQITDIQTQIVENRENNYDTLKESTPERPTENQSSQFVEVETLKHVPGSSEHNVDEERPLPTYLNWQLLNGTASKPPTKIFNDSNGLADKVYNNTLRAVITKNRYDLNSSDKLKQEAVLKNLSSIFQNLASSLGIMPYLNTSFLNKNISVINFTTVPTTSTTSTTTTTTERPQYVKDRNAEENSFGQGQVEVVDADEESLIMQAQASTKYPLVTLIPVKSNSGIGRPLRPRPKRPTNTTDVVENRSFPNDPFYKNLNMDLSELSKSPIKFVQTEVVTSVSTEINKVKINRNQFNDFKILGVLNFESEFEETTIASKANNKNEREASIIENEAELIRNPKMDPKENFTESNIKLQDEVSVFSMNSSVSTTKNERYNILTEEKLRQLSEISKLNTNSSKDEKETVISNKAVSASYTTNQAGFKILTKTFNKIPTSEKDEEKKSVYGFNAINLNIVPNKTECSDFTVRCGDGQCLPDTTRCNQLVDCNDGADEKNCKCVDHLRSQYLLRKICDGVVDCWDFSDENLCEWCKPEQYVCANSKFCISKSKICDGTRDCPSGDDERQCVTVAPDIQAADEFPYYSEGYLMVRKHGKWGKLCMQNFEQIITKLRPPWQIADLGQAVCKAMTYKTLTAVKTISEPFIASTNVNYDDRYYELSYTHQNVTKSNLLFKESFCESKEVVKLQCLTLECGTRPQAVNQLARRMYRIVGGGNAGLGSWPWQAALYKEGEFQCGATLLSDRWLLSAGHCFYHSLEEHWVARLGALRRGTALPSPYEQLRPIIEIILHPGYVDAGFINDISLLKMEIPVVFSDYVRPICLPPPGVFLKDDRVCTVIGWGQLFEVGRIFPDTLQEVQVPIISTTECRKRTLFLPLYKVTDDMFCAGYERGGRDACLGDSGGPLMCPEPDGRWVLQGITSNGYGCARANRPGVYTKVSNYVTWIQSYVFDNGINRNSSRIIRTTCTGHRCPLGECLPKSRICNGYIECSDGSDEKDCLNI